MDFNILTYMLFLVFAIAMTIWVARTLFVNGRVFLLDIFHQNELLTDSVNKLLIVGFYLINIGYALYTLQIIDEILTVRMVMERLSLKLGTIILILGGMHFLNLFIFFSLRKRVKLSADGHDKN